jgi:ACR3 family arsenite efflux pump ArsB
LRAFPAFILDSPFCGKVRLAVGVLSKLQPVFIIFSAFLGITLGRNIAPLVLHSNAVIGYSLMILLLFVFLNINVKEITKSFLNVTFSITALLINFIWTPLFAFALARLFFQGKIDLQLGFIMLMVTPCTDWYLIFTGLSKGNTALGSSILPLNLVLQIVLLPVYILLFFGSSVKLQPGMVLDSIVMVLIVPLVLANGIKLIAGKLPIKNSFDTFIRRFSENIQFLFLCLAILAMFASQGDLLLENPQLFAALFPPLMIFFTANFFLAFFAGKKLKLPFDDIIPLIFTTAARNSPIALAIAAVTFPDRPVVSLALVTGPLIELPVLALVSSILKKIRQGLIRNIEAIP